MKDGGPLKEPSHPIKTWKGRNLSALVLIILGISLILVSSTYSTNHQTQNATTVQGSQGLRVAVTPVNTSLPDFLSSFAQVELTVQSNTPFSNLTVFVVESGHLIQRDYFTYNSTNFAVSYVHIPGNLSGRNGDVVVKTDNAGSAIIPVGWHGTYEGVQLAFLLYSGIAATCLGIAFAVPPRIKIWYFLPLFVVISILFGQRYDDFFLISPGFRIIYGVDPYRPSSSLLPGLQWAYPPLFLLWSYTVDRFYLLLPFTSSITNSSLNYLGTEFGNPFGAWKALAGNGLFVLYGLIKLPLVLSFLWVFRTLKNLTGKEHWKLWLFNPFLIVVSVLWGQLDILAVAFMLQAILFEKRGRTWMAVFAASIGGAIKIFPALIIPYILLRSRNRLVTLTATLPVLGATFVIYGFTGGIYSSVRALLFARAIPTFGGVFVSNGFSWQVILTYLGVSRFPSLFLWIFIPAFFTITVISHWKGIPLIDYSTILVLVFFLTYNFVNPQYLIWLIPLLLLVKKEVYALLLSVLGSIFLIFTYSYTYFLSPVISWNYQSSALGQIENIKVLLLGSAPIRATLAIIATAFFIYMLYHMFEKLYSDKSSTG